MIDWARRNALDVRWAGTIFAAAFVLRLLYVLWNSADPSLTASTDAYFYHHSAKAMSIGRGYIFPGHLMEGPVNPVYGGAPTAYWPPGYTAFLSAVYVLPGPDMIMGKLLNVALGALTCSVVFATGRLMWNRGIGVAAGLILTLWPSHVLFSTLLLTEVSYTFLVALILLVATWGIRSGAIKNKLFVFALGLLVGATTLLRGEGLLLPLVLGAAVWAALSFRAAARFALISFAGVAIMIGGWTVRNVIQLDAPIPINTGSSVVLSLGHWEGADGGGNQIRSGYLLSYYKDEFYPEREVKGYRKRTREALQYWATHPSHEAGLVPRRLFELYRHDHDAIDWLPTEDRPLSETALDALRWLSDVYYGVIALAAIAGAVLWWRANRAYAVLLLGLIAYVSALIGLVFFGDQRYHAVLVPAFALLAGPVLVAGLRMLRQAAGQRTSAP